MNAILETLVAIGIFLGGLLSRLGVVLAVMLALLLPVLAVVGAARALRAVRLWSQGYLTAGALRFRSGLSYAPGHTWVRPEGNRLRVGIDDLAQRLFPWAVAVELPPPGRKVREGEPVAVVSAGGREARVAAPVSGTVVTVNAAVVREPTLLKSDSYGRGWLFSVEPDDRTWRSLPTGEAARGWLRSEGQRLTSFYEQQLGIAATDGGELLGPPPALLGETQWKALTRAFLST
jgi:glycine cleavage system H lipoate-binding protein